MFIFYFFYYNNMHAYNSSNILDWKSDIGTINNPYDYHDFRDILKNDSKVKVVGDSGASYFRWYVQHTDWKNNTTKFFKHFIKTNNNYEENLNLCLNFGRADGTDRLHESEKEYIRLILTFPKVFTESYKNRFKKECESSIIFWD